MDKTRLSLFYLITYLTLTGLALMFIPVPTLGFLKANRDYGDIMPRFAGVLMVTIAAIVSQIVRFRIQALYPTTVVIRCL